LWQATRKLWEAGERQARQTQETIDLGQKQFVSTHRPKIRIKHLRLVDEDFQDGKPLEVQLDIVNTGSTDAILKLYSYALFCLRSGELPKDPPHIGKDHSLNDFSLASGMTLPIKIKAGVYSRNESGDLCFSGGIVYADSMGRIRTTSFYRLLLMRTSRFYLPENPDSDYEYQD
jgi:hypothetical protein